MPRKSYHAQQTENLLSEDKETEQANQSFKIHIIWGAKVAQLVA